MIAAFTPTLVTRITDCCNWIRPFAITTLIIAVAGVAAAIFLSEIFVAIGFALLGVTSILLIIEDTSALTKMQQLQEQIGQNNFVLRKSQQEETTLSASLDKQVQLSADTAERLQKARTQFSAEQDQFQQTVNRWTEEREALQKELAVLKETNKQFASVGPQLKAFERVLSTHASQVLSLGVPLQAVETASKALQEKWKEVSQVLATIDQKAAEIPEQMKKWETVLTALSGYLDTELEMLQKQLEDSHQVLEKDEQDLQGLTADLQQQRLALQEQQKKLEETIATLKVETEKNLASAKALSDVGRQAQEIISSLLAQLPKPFSQIGKG